MVNKPVFIMGCPRSGTTILLDLMCAHEEFAWLSHYSHIFPKQLWLSILNRVYDTTYFGLKLYRKKNFIRNLLPHPTEPWGFWSAFLHNFQWERFGSKTPRRRNKNDLTQEEIKHTRQAVNKVCRYQKKKRFISKYTDLPRIRYLTEVFPDARFVHIKRESFAVINSYHNAVKRGNFNTWDERDWWISGWPRPWQKLWNEKYGSLLSFLALQWLYFLSEIREDAKCLSSDQYIEIWYEDLMDSAEQVMGKILEFCELPFSSRVQEYLKHVQLVNRNYKWQKDLTEEEKRQLQNLSNEPIITEKWHIET